METLLKEGIRRNVRRLKTKDNLKRLEPPVKNYTSGSGTIASVIKGRIASIKKAEERRKQISEVTHGVFFGENIRRVIKAFLR